MMLHESVPPLTRNYSSSSSCIDPFDQAEKGLDLDPPKVPDATHPLEARKTHSFRYSLRSSGSTLVGVPEDSSDLGLDGRTIEPLPSQDEPRRPATWRCGSLVKHLPFIQPNSQCSLNDQPDPYKPGYDQFRNDSHENYPDGWPRVAAFLNSCNSFGIYRRFGQCHSRLLVNRMANITDLERQLLDLDEADEDGGEATQWRLKTRCPEGFDTTRRDLLEKLEKEVNAYDVLLLNTHHLKSLDQTPQRDHDSVFKWIWANKPLDKHQYDWIFHHEDFVSLARPRQCSVENFIREHLEDRPKSFFKKLFRPRMQQQDTEDSTIEFFSIARISLVARLIAVFLAVLVLFIPVILFLLVPMGKACMAIVVLAFVFCFSAMVTLLTDAGIQEIFVGTATYCAVLVTFLGIQQSVTS